MLCSRQNVWWNALSLIALLLLDAASAAACPFCTVESQTLTEEINSSEAVVLARLVADAPPIAEGADNESDFASSDPDSGKATFQIVDVLRGGERVKAGEEIKVVYFGEGERDRTFLISGIGVENDALEWMTPLPLSATAIDYIRKLPNVPASGAERLRFFQEYLENDDPLLAQDAYDEFARAPYSEVKELKGHLVHDRLVEWIQSSDVNPSRRRLYLTMLGVCGDEHDLPIGESYHERIRQAIERADLFLFMISPASISPKRYTLSELKFAQSKWAHPKGRVLPVMMSPTPMNQIPPYLTAVSICMPKGDLAAEVAFEVNRMAKALPSRQGQGVMTMLFGGSKGPGGGAGNYGGGMVQARRAAVLPPLIPCVALFFGIGLLSGLVSFALNKVMWWEAGLMLQVSRGLILGAVLGFMLFFLELGRLRTIGIVGAAAVVGFVLTHILNLYIVPNSWGLTPRDMLYGALRAGIILGAVYLEFPEIKQTRLWASVVGISTVTRAFYLRGSGGALQALSWAVWDAALAAALCYVLWQIAAGRRAAAPSQSRSQPAARQVEQRRT